MKCQTENCDSKMVEVADTGYYICWNCRLCIHIDDIPNCETTREVGGVVVDCVGKHGHIGYHSEKDIKVTEEPKISYGSHDDSHS